VPAYGYDFDILATFTVTRRSTLFHDDTGALVREIRHVDFERTLYRSTDLSRTIPYAGRWQRTLGVAAGTVTITGLWLYSHPDGSGLITLAAGRQITDAETGELVSANGRVPTAASRRPQRTTRDTELERRRETLAWSCDGQPEPVRCLPGSR
jgi:hypothetical protein